MNASNIILIDKLFCQKFVPIFETKMLKGFFEGQKFLEGDMKLQNLQIDNQIGRGNSDVFLARIDKQKIAMKQTQIKNDYQYKNFLQQISMLKKLSQNNDNIIKYEGYFVTEIKEQKLKTYSNKKYGYLLMQRAQMNLGQYIRIKQQNKQKLSNNQIIKSIQKILNGLTFLQSMMIAHCDIKPQNILIINKNKLDIKICDVGSCKIIDKQQQNQSTIKGTLSFLAPQLIKIDDIKITSINPFRSDVYSFGLVILYMISGKKFTSHQRKQIQQEVYYQIINQWIKYASEIVNQQVQIVQILKKSLQFDQFKRPLFKQLKLLFESLKRKRKIQFDNKLKKNKRQQTQSQSVQTRNQGYLSQKPKLPKLNSLNLNNTSSTTLMSFHSRTRLTGKIQVTNSKSQSKKSSDKSQKDKTKRTKISNGKQSKSKMTPFQKTTMYSTFSLDKSKLSVLGESKKIIAITNQNHNFIPFENLNQQQKIFVLFSPHVLFEHALNVVIKKQCNVQVFDKLSHIKSAVGLYLDYSGVQIYGVDQNIPTLTTFQLVYLNLQHSSVQSGYNNLLRFLCPISIKGLFLQLTGSQITFNQVKLQIQRLKNKDVGKLDLCWDKCSLSYEQFIQINDKISKLPLKKLILSLGSAFMKANEKARWLLPSKCKTLYLNFPNNFLSSGIGSLGISLSELNQLKQFYLNLENNCLNDTDIKVIIKSLKNLKSLEKTVLNFSWNQISKGIYCFQQLSLLSKISSLQLRLTKCGLSFQDFQQIFSHLITLFNSGLKILKLTYDRKITKNTLHTSLQKIIKQQINQSLKLDIVGYNFCNFMIYVKKKSQGGTQKNIKLKIKQKYHQTSQLTSTKNIQSTSSLTANRTIPYLSINNKQKQQKQQQDQFSTLPNLNINLKQTSDKNIDKKQSSNQHKICQTLFSTYPSYECYICLGCIQNKQMSKFQYFCRACIQNCQHKGHNIVRTYDKKICNCSYNNDCYFRIQDNNQFICAQKLGIQYKKQYQCLKCNPKRSYCQG